MIWGVNIVSSNYTSNRLFVWRIWQWVTWSFPNLIFAKQLSGHGVAAVKSDRFTAPKEITPGPGQYNVSDSAGKPKHPAAPAAPKSRMLNRQSSFRGAGSKNGSRTSSTASLYTDVDDNIRYYWQQVVCYMICPRVNFQIELVRTGCRVTVNIPNW